MEHCDGEIPIKRLNLPDGGDDGGGGGGSEDRLSALPDDVLIEILLKLLDAAVAARTSVLSSRWRRLWRLLPGLYFPSGSGNDPQRIRLALAAHEAPTFRNLEVRVLDGTPDSVASWLPFAARRLSGGLCLINSLTRNGSEDMAGERSAFELPCFESATSIFLSLGYIGLAVPSSSGVFARLTELELNRIAVHGACTLGDAVSSPCCPVLQNLVISDSCHLGNFTIHSESLLEMKLMYLRGLQQLTVMAPALKLLDVRNCFAPDFLSYNQPVVSISAPQLLTLLWRDFYDPRFMQLGKMENLEWLGTYPLMVYGQDEYKILNSFCTRLLQRFELIQNLILMLVYRPEDLTNQHYLMEQHITRLPYITFMVIDIVASGHSFGACSFHVLRMCTSLRKLSLTVGVTTIPVEEETACLSSCACHQPPNWKTDELVLSCLREVEIHNLRGTEHEAALVKRLFDWATVLEEVTITLHCSVATNVAKEFCQRLQSFSRPGIRMEGSHFS
uniref:Uncharacterized protein n=1 Tax=Avena sativa TaxID=4498 RepID=A0ACD5ZHN3_AVESA